MSLQTSRAGGWKLLLGGGLITAAVGCMGFVQWHGSEAHATSTTASPSANFTTKPAPKADGEFWQTFFSTPQKDAATAAREQLETAGLPLNGAGLVQAVEMNHRAFISLYRKAGVDLNEPDEQGRTALLASALTKNWALFDELLNAGARPEIADEEGVTPLMAAIAAGKADKVKALLDKGAPIDVADFEGRRAVHYAVATKNLSIFETLVARGANCVDTAGQEPSLVQMAWAANDWRFVVPILEKQAPTLTWNAQSRAGLMAALQWKDLNKVRLLMSKHPQAPVAEGDTQPLLVKAVAEGNLSMFRLLLDGGADPNTLVNTPVGAEFGKLVSSNVMRHYLEEETNVTALMLAAGLGRNDFAKELVSRGARRNAVTGKYKMNAAIFASKQEDAKLLQLLIGDAPAPDAVRIEISLAMQEATLYRSGVPVYRTPISSGRSGYSTPSGEFVVTDKHQDHRSTIYKVPMPYFMRLNFRDFGMHQGQLPGYPASHGCIRLPTEAARNLFKQVPVGTLVSIR